MCSVSCKAIPDFESTHYISHTLRELVIHLPGGQHGVKGECVCAHTLLCVHVTACVCACVCAWVCECMYCARMIMNRNDQK